MGTSQHLVVDRAYIRAEAAAFVRHTPGTSLHRHQGMAAVAIGDTEGVDMAAVIRSMAATAASHAGVTKAALRVA